MQKLSLYILVTLWVARYSYYNTYLGMQPKVEGPHDSQGSINMDSSKGLHELYTYTQPDCHHVAYAHERINKVPFL